jgi:hypothetical protein
MAFRTVRDAMPWMSVRELRSAAVRAARINKLFDSDIVRPMKMTRVSCRPDASRIHLTFGGQWIMIMHDDGSLNFHQTRDIRSPLMSIVRPHYPSVLHWDHHPHMDVRMTSVQEMQLVIASEIFTSLR